nr:hypothetical protein CFP56_04427 [Quercus suber]
MTTRNLRTGGHERTWRGRGPQELEMKSVQMHDGPVVCPPHRHRYSPGHARACPPHRITAATLSCRLGSGRCHVQRLSNACSNLWRPGGVLNERSRQLATSRRGFGL